MLKYDIDIEDSSWDVVLKIIQDPSFDPELKINVLNYEQDFKLLEQEERMDYVYVLASLRYGKDDHIPFPDTFFN